ncbi:hypothetical protein SNE40_007297 [Patella caerulea]|uniref:Aminopeptidase n=2 Tax=Patella caerulea TaxID=87958 RepID=A0AAN8JYJ0_PATCE
MNSEPIEFTDMGKYNSHTDLTSNKSTKGGFFVSTAKAFILVLLAILIAVVIGLIVHFAGSGKEVVCKCSEVPASSSIADRLTECKTLAVQGNMDICTACSKGGMTMSTTTAPPTTPTKPDVRLPRHLQPIFYEVELQPHMYNDQPKTFTFDGSVRIQIRCVEASNNVTLQINKLNITRGSLLFGREGAGSAPNIKSWEEDTTRQFLIIHLDGDLTVGATYFVQMEFAGPLKDDLAGLYLSKYDYNNETRYVATTQLQPTDARRVFPCFDEPAIKARFNITLVRKSNKKTISNMPIAQSIPRADDWVADVYYTTPKMSTYLLAFIVCDFEVITETTQNNIEYGAWATPGKTDQATYALDTGVKILTYFEEYFNISFPLPKQDMVAMPDFSAGAMENWGLIIYRETAMLYKPGVSSEGNKQRVAVVVSHELAHQWFGNLVTPSWWDDLWLNEGFASFVEYMGVDYCHPDWKMFEQFVVEDLQDVFDFDGLTTSHPVYVPVGHPDEINEIFDRVSYAKGASIIRMMRFFLGEDTFRLGLTKYLKRKEYDAAFHDDLWQALTEQAQSEGKSIDVKSIMDTWTLQMNYPTVTITREGNNLRLTQKRYLRDPSAVDPMKYTSDFGYKWEIPFTYTTSIAKHFNKSDADVKWIRKTETETAIVGEGLPPITDGDGWIIGNVQQYGFYRVNYESSNWLALIKQLNTDHKVISAINRAQIINDAWNLVTSGDLDITIALKTLEYLNKEEDYVPREAARIQIAFVERMLSKSPVYGAWKKFMLSRIQEPFSRWTMNNTGASHLDSYVRSLVVSTACDYDLPACISDAKSLFKQWMDNPSNNPINPGIKTKVYCTAIKYGGVAEWDFAFEQFKTAEVAAEKVRLLQGMACSQELWILRRYLLKAIRKEDIRKQDTLSVIIYVSTHAYARSFTWDFVREHWNTIKEDFAVSLFAFSNMIGRVTRAFNTEFELQQLEEFMKSQSDFGSGERAFTQALEKAKTNIKWINQHEKTIENWLAGLRYD